MKEVELVEAEAKLSAIVDDAARGDEVVITRGGRPMARLVGVVTQLRREDIQPPSPELAAKRRAALARLREIAARINLRATQEEIKSWINEGRR